MQESDGIVVPPRRPTLADVAARAGVSRTTASNAYNRPDQLSVQQRENVLAAAAELGYFGPDPVARSLRMRSAEAVGLIFAAKLSVAFSDPAAVEFLHGVAQACEERDRSLLLIPAGPDATNTAMVDRAAVDGFLVFSMPDQDPHVDAVLARRQAVVVVDSPTDIDRADFIGIADRSGFAAVAEHVLGLGHRRLGVVTTSTAAGAGVSGLTHVDPTDYTMPTGRHAVFRDRLFGLRDALTGTAGTAGTAGTGGTARPEERAVTVVVRNGDINSHECGRQAAAELVELPQPPTAIMCTSDVLAFGVLAELADRGIEVPAQMTVTGFDDVPDAADRGLTTVSQPTHEKGYLAAGLLLDRAVAPERAPMQYSRRILDTELIVRTSSGPPRPTTLRTHTAIA